MASLSLTTELDLKYRSRILLHFIVFQGEKGMGVLKTLYFVCHFKKMKIVLLVYLFLYIP